MRCTPPALSNPVLDVYLEDLRRQKQKDSLLGSDLEDLRDAHHHPELECQRSARRKGLLARTSSKPLPQCRSYPNWPHLHQRCWPPCGWPFLVVVAHTEVLTARQPPVCVCGRRRGGGGGREVTLDKQSPEIGHLTLVILVKMGCAEFVVRVARFLLPRQMLPRLKCRCCLQGARSPDGEIKWASATKTYRARTRAARK